MIFLKNCQRESLRHAKLRLGHVMPSARGQPLKGRAGIALDMRRAVNYVCAVTFACFAMFLTACDWRVYGDNVEQKRMSNALEQDLSRAKLDKTILFNSSVTALPSYARECRDSKPAIPHKKCLFLAVENKTMAEAKLDVAVFVRTFRNQTQTANFVKYSNYHLVLLPLVRNPNYAGYVTPYSIEKSFEIGQSVLLQIGK